MRSRVTNATEQGPRSSQEDRLIVALMRSEPQLWLLAVMDGFGGSSVSELCASRLEEAVSTGITNGSRHDRTLVNAVSTVASQIDDDRAGTTISAALVDEELNCATAAVLGDSPVIVRTADGSLRVGADHHAVRNRAERQRAISRGAQPLGALDAYGRWTPEGPYLGLPGSGGIILTRALGAKRLTYLDSAPETLQGELGPESYVLVASDGVYTRTLRSAGQLAQYVDERLSTGVDADDIVSRALEEGATDNVTAILWTASV